MAFGSKIRTKVKTKGHPFSSKRLSSSNSHLELFQRQLCSSSSGYTCLSPKTLASTRVSVQAAKR